MFLILASIVVFNLVVMFKLSFSDSCIDGWQEFNGSCYLFNKESRGYAMADAQMFCQKFGGDLVIITSEAENSFILQQITSTNRRIFWIGLNDIKEEGKFEWIDGSQLNFTNWDDKEPNDLLEEDCAAIYFGGKWNDFNCNREASLICETKLGLLPQVTNSPTLLNDTDESPICEPGWITWGKSCYDINTRIYASAEKAQSDCEENLSNLLVIDSKEEQIFLITKLANKTQNFWIGLFKNHTSFIWYGGKILNETLSNWNVNEPAECKNCNCVLMTKGFWSTYACDLPTSYICEKVSVDPKVITLFNAELEIAEGSRNTYTFIGFGVPKPVSILLFGEKAISLTSSSSIGNNSYKYVYQIGPLDVSDCGRTFVHKLVGKFSTVTQNTTAVVLPKVKTLEVFLLNETVIVSWEAILKDHCTLAHNVEWLDVNHTVVHEVCIKNGSTASFSSLKNETDILGVRVYLTSSCTQHQRLSFVEGQERENITVIFAEQKSDAITEIMVDLKPTSLPFGNTKHMKMISNLMYELDKALRQKSSFKPKSRVAIATVSSFKDIKLRILYENITLMMGSNICRSLEEILNTKVPGDIYSRPLNIEVGALWELDLLKCQSSITQKLIALNESSQTIPETAKIVEEKIAIAAELLTSSSLLSTYYDVSLTADIIFKILSAEESFSASKKMLENVISLASIVLGVNQSLVVKAQSSHNSSNKVLTAVGAVAAGFTDLVKKDNEFSVLKENVGMIMKVANQTGVTVIAFNKSNTEMNISIAYGEVTFIDEDILASIYIPKTALHHLAIVSAVVYRSPYFFLNKNESINIWNSGSNRKSVITSAVVSVDVVSQTINNLTEPISIVFKKPPFQGFRGSFNCFFWNSTIDAWSNNGCYKVKELSENISCRCNHLTNFALILDTSQIGNNPLELQIVSWIGCCISLVALFFTLVILLMRRKLIQERTKKIHVFLCLSLMALLILFLTAAERRRISETKCKYVAAGLQYFVLTTFCWMAVEGVNLYMKVTVLRKLGSRSFLLKSSLFAWGAPLLIVGYIGALHKGSLGNEKFCTVNGYPFYFGLLLPVACIMLINLFVLSLVMIIILRPNSDLLVNAKKEGMLSNIQKSVCNAFIFSCLLGTSWLFAVLAVGKATIVFQWFFCVFNSLQGLFLFVCLIVLNPLARSELYSCIPEFLKPNSYQSVALKKKENDVINETTSFTH